VSQDVAVNKGKIKREQIDKMLFQHGDPKIFDLPGFMDLSEQKKIDLIFTLFPPEADLSGIDEKLELLAGEEKTITAELKSIGLVIERMTKERSEIALPAGTMAEIKASITEKEKQLAEAEEAIKEIEAQERADKAKEDAEAKAKAEAERIKAKAEADAVEALKKAEKEKQEAVKAAEAKGREEAKAETKIEAQEAKEEAAPVKTTVIPGEFTQVNAVVCRHDFERILAIMQETKCPQCAAIIFIKTLIRKYQGKEAA
jgi:cell pole-organizing protein PopZ